MYQGASTLVRNDPYELRFAFPKGENFTITAAEAHIGETALPVKITNHQGWATVRFTANHNADARWKVQFAPAEFYHYPPPAPKSPPLSEPARTAEN